MKNVTFETVEYNDGTIQQNAIIDHGNGEHTSMPKSTYDEQQEALANGNNI